MNASTSNPRPLPRSIYFDADALISIGHDLQKPWFDKLVQVAQEHKIQLFVPKLALDEWCYHLEEHFENRLRTALSSIESAKGIILDNTTQIDVASLLARKNCIAGLQEKRLADRGIQIIPIIHPPIERLINDAIKHVPPFQKGDKGFRDAIILESIADFASRLFPNSQVIVVSKDKAMHAGVARLTRANLEGLVVDFEAASDRAQSEYMSRIWDHITRRGEEEAVHFRQFETQVFDAIRSARVSSAFFMCCQEAQIPESTYVEGIVACNPKAIKEAHPGTENQLVKLPIDRHPLRLEVDVEFTLVVSESYLFGSMAEVGIPVDRPGSFKRQFPEQHRREVCVTMSVTVDASVLKQGTEAREYTGFCVERVGMY